MTAQELILQYFLAEAQKRVGTAVTGVTKFADGILQFTGTATSLPTIFTTSVHSVGGDIPVVVNRKDLNPQAVFVVFPGTSAPGDHIRMHVDGSDIDYTLPLGTVVTAGGTVRTAAQIAAALPSPVAPPSSAGLTAQDLIVNHYLAIPVTGVKVSYYAPGILQYEGTTNRLPSIRSFIAKDLNAPSGWGNIDVVNRPDLDPQSVFVIYPGDAGRGDKVIQHMEGVEEDFPVDKLAAVNPGGVMRTYAEILNVLPPLRTVNNSILTKRKLLVGEFEPTSPHYGKMFALDPNSASGISLPTWRIGTALPAVGTLVGEGFVNTADQTGYVWDGTVWQPILPNPINQYPTEAVLLAAAPLGGTYGFAGDTGNLFARIAEVGGTVWRQVGVRHYDTETSLKTDVPAAGTLGFAQDTKTTFLWNGTKWTPIGPVTGLVAAIKLLKPIPQQLAISTDTNELFIGGDDGIWHAQSGYTKLEVDNKLTTIVTGLAHDIAVLDILDTPPATPVEGDAYIIGLAPTGIWVGKNDQVAYYDQGAWIYTAPQPNEAHLVEAKQGIYAWSPPPGGASGSLGAYRWVRIATTSGAAGVSAKHGVGEIIPWMADTVPDDYLECRGQVVAIASYPDLHAIIGNKYNPSTSADGTTTFALPDLRGYFLRGIGANGGESQAGIVQDDRTRLPRAANFTGSTGSGGSHLHDITAGFYNHYATGGGGLGMNDWSTYYAGRTGQTASAGDHTHAVTITGGGDAETRPKSVSVRWVIRVRPIDGGAMGPRGSAGVGIPHISAADEGKSIKVVGGNAVWATGAGIPDGTITGQTLEWNGTTWLPSASKIISSRANEFVVAATPAMYELQGAVWASADSLLQLKLYAADGTTQLVPDASWTLKGMNTVSVATYSALTSMTTDSDSHCSRGYWIESNGTISLGRNLIGSAHGWSELDLKMVCTSNNGRGNAAPIIVRYSYLDAQDFQNNGVVRIFAPNGMVIGKVTLTTGAATTYYNMVLRTTSL